MGITENKVKYFSSKCVIASCIYRRAAYIVRIRIESPWNPGQIYLLVQGNRVSAQERILPTNKTVAEEELDLDDIGSFVL